MIQIPIHIAQRIREAITQGGSYPIDVEAQGHDAIVLMGTIGSIWMLRADGTFWDADADFGKPLTPLPAEYQTMALVYGAERHPWLAALLPQRPSGADDCTTCAGIGKFFPSTRTNPQPGKNGICCNDCNGLGWRVGKAS